VHPVASPALIPVSFLTSSPASIDFDILL